MNPFYRNNPSMQPSPADPKRRPVPKRNPFLGVAALCAIAGAAYFIMSPEKPLVLAPNAMASVTPADSFRRIAGSGARPMHIFISVDCAFCRQIEPELERLKDVTVHYHLLPGHSASARADALNVWCASDQVKAWSAAARGDIVAAPACDGLALDRNHALAMKLGIERTPSMIFADGKVLAGAASSEVIERELARSEKGK
jgi:thiol:disulfide interchange protein DsbC